jgi:hypothetical protein
VDNADAVEERRDRFAGGGLARRARDADDEPALPLRPRDPAASMKRSELTERVGGVVDHEDGTGRRDVAAGRERA